MVPDGATNCPNCGLAQATAPAAPAGSPQLGMEPNIAGALAYIWIVAIIWLVLEPYNKNRFIRFHAFQALAFTVVWFVMWWVLAFLPLLNLLLIPVAWLGGFVLWVFLVYKAYSNEYFKLPVIGDWALTQAGPAQ
jgi:uncharacterized membrane protein